MNKDIKLEDLGFSFEEIKKINHDILYNGKVMKHKFIYRCNPSIEYKYSWLDIEFNLLTKEISFFQNSMNGGNGPIVIGEDLRQAILNKCEELGWLDD